MKLISPQAATAHDDLRHLALREGRWASLLFMLLLALTPFSEPPEQKSLSTDLYVMF